MLELQAVAIPPRVEVVMARLTPLFDLGLTEAAEVAEVAEVAEEAFSAAS
jgi:hypothetical protein